MKITFVGTSHGVPAADRFCFCVMIESGDSVYFIDAGAPIAKEVLRYGREVTDIRAVFNTHNHCDHTAGLFELVDLITWYYKSHSMEVYVADEPIIGALAHMIAASEPGMELSHDRVHFHVAEAGVCYEDKNIKVEYIPTSHMKAPFHSYAILVSEGEKRVLFSGDLSRRLEQADVPDLIEKEPIDLYVTELAHFGMAEMKPYLDRCQAKRVGFLHVAPLSKYEDIEAIRTAYPFEILTPCDGDAFEI